MAEGDGGRYTHGYYGVGKPQEDFGLSYGMALPPNTMPAEKDRGRKRAATFSVKDDAEKAVSPAAEPKPSLGAKLRSFFKRGKQRYVEDVGARDSQVAAESGTVESSTFQRSDIRGREKNKKVSFQGTPPSGKPRRGKSFSFTQKNGQDKKGKGAAGETSQSFDQDKVFLIKLTLKPRNAVTPTETRKVTLRRQADGFGVHLSAGLPPIKVTYVKTGGMAELAGVEVGDAVMEVNGQSCTEGVEISKIMELKMLLQHTAVGSDAIEDGVGEGEDIDDSAWKKIQERQKSLESDSSDVEVTMIDEESESENEKEKESTPVEKPTQVPAKAKPKKRRPKKKKDTSLSTKVELPVEQPQSLPMTEEPQDLAMTEQQQDLGKDSPNELQKKKKARVSKPRPPLSAETSTEPTAAAVAAAPEVTVSPTSETKPKKRKKKRKDASTTEESWTQQQDFVLDAKPATEKKKRAKKSSTNARLPSEAVPPATVGAPVSPTAPPTSAETETPPTTTATDNRVAPGSEIMQGADGRVRIKGGGKKRKKSKTLLDDGKTITSTPVKKQKKHSSSRKTSDGEGKLNKSKSGSVQSDTLKWVGAEGLKQVADNSHSLPRHSTQDDREILGLSPINADKRSPSVHAIGGDAELKPFREELRQTSKSEYDMPELYGGAAGKLEPNLKVRKSGVVIGTHTREERRPSIFDKSSSLEEVDEGTEGEHSEGAKKKVSTIEMDLSAIPKLNPCLGISHGHNRLELVSRGSNRRRPASLRRTLLLDTEDSALMGTKRVDLSAEHDDRPVRRQTMPSQSTAQKNKKEKGSKSKDDSSLVFATKTPPTSPVKQPQKEKEKKEEREREEKEKENEKPTNHVLEAHINRMKSPLFSPSTNDLSTSTAAVVKKQLSQNGANKSFQLPTRQSVVSETNSQDSTPNSSLQRAGRRVKTVDTPVKTLGIASESSKTESPSPVKLRRPRDEAVNTPSWVAIAQVKQKRVSAVYDETEASSSSKEVKRPEPISKGNKKVATPSTSSKAPPTISKAPPLSRKGDSLLPRAGTVKDRMALFQ